MADVTIRRLGEFQTLGKGVFHRVRDGLGVSSFGINVEAWPPGSSDYPEHDETESGQEEVYLALSGRAFLLVDGDEFVLEPGVFARVGPGERRKIVTRGEADRASLCRRDARCGVRGAQAGSGLMAYEFKLPDLGEGLTEGGRGGRPHGSGR